MKAYKGFHKDMTCTCGAGAYQYREGETHREEKSKTQRTGMHCAENPLECLRWYPLGSGSRYFIVEASGSLDELGGEDTQIACTKMEILKELSIKELAGHAMMYMVRHPLRAWEMERACISVKRDRAEAEGKGCIAIARGPHPRAKGGEGAILGLIREADGLMEEAKLFEVKGEIKPGTWYGLEERSPKEAPHEA